MPIPKLMFQKGLVVYRVKEDDSVDADVAPRVEVRAYKVTKAGEHLGEVRELFKMRDGQHRLGGAYGARVELLRDRFEVTAADAIRAFIERNATRRQRAVREIEVTAKLEKQALDLLHAQVTL